MKVITYITKKDQYYDSLEDSCKKFNYDLITLGIDTKWNGMGDKIKGVRNYISELENKDEFVLVVDGYDVIACRDSKDIIDEFNNTFNDKDVIFNSERLPSSYFLSYLWERNYTSKKCGNTKYNKLNAGVLMAKINVLLEFYDFLISEYNLNKKHIKSDQRLIYDIIDKDEKNIRIDSNCNLFTTVALSDDIIVKENKLYNNYSKTYPFFIHAPGKNTKMDSYINTVDVKLTYHKPNALDQNNIHKHYINFDLLVFTGLLIFLISMVLIRYQRYKGSS